MPQKALPGLDAIRLAAILWIVLYHYGAEMTVAGAYSPVFFTTDACAALVVGAVFWMTALSGACLSLKYAAAPFAPGSYAKNRFWAIYPLFWLFFFPLFLYSDVLHRNNANVAPWRLVFSVLGVDGYLAGWTPTFYKIGEWYLGCQVLLYCLFPLVLFALRRRARQGVLAAALLVLWGAAPFLLPENVDLFHTVCGQLPVFAAGAAFGRWLADLPQAGRRPLAATVGLLAAAVLCHTARLPDYYTYSLAALGLFWPAFWLGQLLRGRAAALAHRAARLCYGVFLVHHVGITLVLAPRLRALPASPLLWGVGLAACLAGSFLAAWVGQAIVGFLRRRLGRAKPRPGPGPGQ